MKSLRPFTFCLLTFCLLSTLCLLATAGCTAGQWKTNPVSVVADSAAAPADRLASAEVLYNSAAQVLILAREDKLIDDATWHRIRVASDGFNAAIDSLKTQTAAGLALDGNALWRAALAALDTLVQEKGNVPHAGSPTSHPGAP